MLDIVKMISPEEMEAARNLILEYSRCLDFKLDFQNFEEEMSNFPGDYSEPEGTILLAVSDGEYAGCVALRQIDKYTCEMKRLYVKEDFRSRYIGLMLSQKLILEAKAKAYQKMKLDTAPAMTAAIGLYTSLGFRETEPYRLNPIKGAKFFELDLND
jgi:ribosomal protein S18 acetylase RimI-like enzyme